MKWCTQTILSQSSQKAFIESCKEKISRFKASLLKAPIKNIIQQWQEVNQHLRQLLSLARCLNAEDVNNQEAIKLMAVCLTLEASFEKAGDEMSRRLTKEKIQTETLPSQLAYPLEQRRFLSIKKMTPEKEALSHGLAIHGFHSWNELYKVIIGQMTIHIQEKEYSFNQASNFLSHPDRSVRKEAFDGIEIACRKQQHLFAQILRSIVGFRLTLYQERGWKNPTQEALWKNHLDQSSLNAMWKAVEKNAHRFHEFCKKTASFFSLEKLSWFDLEAPLAEKNASFSYEKGSQIILESFASFSRDLETFSKKAFEENWIEAEDRKGKAAGGFCTPLPLTKQSRIFMTYSETMHSLLVLAHELGHAYHNHALFDLPEMAQLYPLSLAETASTTAELLLLDGLLRHAKTQEEKLSIFYEKAKRSSLFFLNIRARFLFEQACFEECSNGFVSTERFCQLMEEAQKTAYGNTLDCYHPYFWISKLHFYLTELPCYNFPYTCGYLFSLAIYAKAKEKPLEFENWYLSFLKDSGQFSVEKIAKKHFNADLSTPDFWEKAIQIAISDIESFSHLFKEE